ncbi:MAG: sterol desaturase family protein [Pseudomonadota bacterium]
MLLLLAADILRRGGWRKSLTRRAAESVLASIAIFHINLFVIPGIWLLSDRIKIGYDLLGIPSIPISVWAGLPVWLLAVVAIVAHDFANYWNHRLMHQPWLWPVHAIHHSDPVVNGMTSYRIHALESLVMWGSYTILLTWMGLPADALGVGAVLLALHNIYVHIDVDWGHGPFRLLIASPRFHRWHHADVPDAYGKNLANVIPLFDWMFGTYRVPGPCKAPLGATGIPRNDVLLLTCWPVIAWFGMMSDLVRRHRHGSSARPASPPQLRAPQ